MLVILLIMLVVAVPAVIVPAGEYAAGLHPLARLLGKGTDAVEHIHRLRHAR